MRQYLFLIPRFAAASLSSGEASAGHIQNISQETAASMCKSAGATGTTCGYCHADHCHEIDCNEKGKCTNTVVTSRSGSGLKGAAGTAISGRSGIKSVDNPPPKRVIDVKQPVTSGVNKH